MNLRESGLVAALTGLIAFFGAGGLAPQIAAAQPSSARSDPAAPSGPASPREEARALAASGKLAQALSLYDELTAPGSTDVSLYVEAGAAAKSAGDRRRIALYGERQIKIDPGNNQIRQLIPVGYQLAGDLENARRSREEFVAYWKASADPELRSHPSFLIDYFKVGAFSITVFQCIVIGGDFGVGYVFDILGPKALPLSTEEAAANNRERIVLEHNRLDQRVLSELTHKEATMSPTLDALYANGHATLKFFTQEPSYAELRDLVSQHVAEDPRLAERPALKDAWRGINCQRADSLTRP